ncbi:MAG: RNA polymerase sigma factor [Deltaproteobacteria bacterium]|nr:RNA polymerase sigma factor [Deltaproteobacteria bacterium]
MALNLKTLKPLKVGNTRPGLGALIEACQAKVRAFIAKRVPAADREDVFQEAVGNLIAADRVRSVKSVAAWLFRAVKNEIIDRGRKVQASLKWEADSELEEIYEVLERPGATLEEEYLRALFWRELFQALAELPAKTREVFEKTEFEGLSFKELADLTGTNVNTLLARKRKVNLFLRERLKDLYDLIVRL